MHKKDKLNQLIKENWGFCLFLLLMFASRSSLADWYVVPTGSMQPTIVEGDRVFVNKMAYRLDVPFTDISLAELDSPERGDIVVFNSEKADTRMIKRVIGVPGDTVSMDRNRLYLNGKPLNYLSQTDSIRFIEQLGEIDHQIQLAPVETNAHSFATVRVPEGHFLVLGDNRNMSADSRYYGFVPTREIQGKALKVIVSLDPENYYLPRGERSFSELIYQHFY